MARESDLVTVETTFPGHVFPLSLLNFTQTHTHTHFKITLAPLFLKDKKGTPDIIVIKTRNNN